MKTPEEVRDIIRQVKSGEIYLSCFDCGDKYRIKDIYDGTFTCRIAKCGICGEEKEVSSAKKIFGYHRFL
jgi:transcription elongation factor Elf1